MIIVSFHVLQIPNSARGSATVRQPQMVGLCNPVTCTSWTQVRSHTRSDLDIICEQRCMLCRELVRALFLLVLGYNQTIMKKLARKINPTLPNGRSNNLPPRGRVTLELHVQDKPDECFHLRVDIWMHAQQKTASIFSVIESGDI